MDKTLINLVHTMAVKEKKVKEFKKRLRLKAEIIDKNITKKGNFRLKVKKEDQEYNFTILKSHKEKFQLVEKLGIGTLVLIEGISKFKYIICTKIKKNK